MNPRDPDPHLVQMLRVMVLLASAGFLATNRSRRIHGIFGSWFRRRAGMGQDWGQKVTGGSFLLPVSGAGSIVTRRSNFLQAALPLALA